MPSVRPATLAAWLLFFSGAAALISEVLWARAVLCALGGTHRVEALVLGTFFFAIPLGAALGAHWVRLPADGRRLWRLYALCEGLTALSVVAPIALSRGVFSGWQTGAAYVVLSCLLLPGAAVGASWPLLVAIVRARGGELGKLYGLNTLGSALGCLTASFWLIEHLGTSGGLLVAGAISACLSLSALTLSRVPFDESITKEQPLAPAQPGDERLIWLVGILAGFLTLSFEVLGARLLALRVPTTAYSLGLVLAVQLAGMAAGARLAPQLLAAGVHSLSRALLVGALALAWAPLLTSLNRPIDPEPGWFGELRTAWLAASTLGPGAVALGLLFPLASAWLSQRRPQDFARLGKLAALNGIAGLAAAAAVGLLLIPMLGLGASFGLLVFTAGGVSIYCAWRASGVRPGLLGRGALVALALVSAAQFSPTRVAQGERLLAQAEGPMGVAAVIDDGGGRRRLVVDGSYTLGDNLSSSVARRFALLPALLHPTAKQMLLVGLGTGITGGAAQEVMSARGGSLQVAELMPEVVELSPHFSRWQARFGAPAMLHIADGRRVLRDSQAEFDLIVFDVVLPWRPGDTFLYTAETFALARARLSDDGLFVLWLPIYQLSAEGFGAIMQTFVSVFPEARLFAGGLDPARQIVALTSGTTARGGSAGALALLQRTGVIVHPPLSHPQALAALDLGAASAVLRALKSRGLLARSEIQHDDRTWIEFDSARARNSPRRLRADGFLDLLGASDAARGGAPTTGLASLLHAAWRSPAEARAELMRELSALAP